MPSSLMNLAWTPSPNLDLIITMHTKMHPGMFLCSEELCSSAILGFWWLLPICPAHWPLLRSSAISLQFQMNDIDEEGWFLQHKRILHWCPSTWKHDRDRGSEAKSRLLGSGHGTIQPFLCPQIFPSLLSTLSHSWAFPVSHASSIFSSQGPVLMCDYGCLCFYHIF